MHGDLEAAWLQYATAFVDFVNYRDHSSSAVMNDDPSLLAALKAKWSKCGRLLLEYCELYDCRFTP